MTPQHVDLLAIGCGPFNLGLMALADGIDGLSAVALEARDSLSWHPGLMLDDAMLQVSFMADLVTLVDPSHPLSWLRYIQAKDRMYAFYIREQFHPTRLEYEDYLRWSADQLSSIRWGHRVDQVTWDDAAQRFEVRATADGERVLFTADHLVVGIGTKPKLPPALADLPASHCLHSASYVPRKSELDPATRVTVIGSGQSGAEVFRDLMRERSHEDALISWFTRTVSFAPLDYTKLVLEMTTPEYIEYFHGLEPARRDAVLSGQWRHYKGISESTLEDLHDLLYHRHVVAGGPDVGVALRCATGVEAARMDGDEVVLTLHHEDTGTSFEHRTDKVVAATGYGMREPHFLAPIADRLDRDARGRFAIDVGHAVTSPDGLGGRVFVTHADLHTHGAGAPDLGICAWRNARILHRVTGRQIFQLPERTAFTTFAPPQEGTR